MLVGEILAIDGLEVVIVPVQLVVATIAIVIQHVGHLYTLVSLVSQPTVGEFVALQRDDDILV